jgi:hypothetical protein
MRSPRFEKELGIQVKRMDMMLGFMLLRGSFGNRGEKVGISLDMQGSLVCQESQAMSRSGDSVGRVLGNA